MYISSSEELFVLFIPVNNAGEGKKIKYIFQIQDFTAFCQTLMLKVHNSFSLCVIDYNISLSCCLAINDAVCGYSRLS